MMEGMANEQILMFFFWIWFCTLYLLPCTIIFKLTSVEPKAASLEGLILKPRKNKNKNILSVDNNIEEFIKSLKVNEKIKKYSVVLKILKTMCNDAKCGEKYHPELYLSILKNTFDRFFSVMLLFSFFPVVMSLIFGKIIISFYDFLLIQLLCTGLVVFINVIVKNKYYKFNEIYFKNWYDKILNFDLIAINEIKSGIQKDSDSNEDSALADIIPKLINMSAVFDESIKHSTSLLTEKLDEFMKFRQTSEFISYKDVLGSMQSGIEKIGELSNSYEQISGNINTALSGLNELASMPKSSIEAINGNAALLKEIRDKFSGYQEASCAAELAQLQTITVILENNVGKTFSSIEAALNKTTQSLGDSYDRFFEMCKKFNETHSAIIGSKQIADALAILLQENKKFDEYFLKYNKIITGESCQ